MNDFVLYKRIKTIINKFESGDAGKYGLRVLEKTIYDMEKGPDTNIGAEEFAFVQEKLSFAFILWVCGVETLVLDELISARNTIRNFIKKKCMMRKRFIKYDQESLGDLYVLPLDIIKTIDASLG